MFILHCGIVVDCIFPQVVVINFHIKYGGNKGNILWWLIQAPQGTIFRILPNEFN